MEVAIVSILVSDSDVAIQQTRFGDWIDSICFYFGFRFGHCHWYNCTEYRIRTETDTLAVDEIHAWENLIEASNNNVNWDRRVVVFAILQL